MKLRSAVLLMGLSFVGGVGLAFAAETNPTIYTDRADCKKLPSMKGAQNCEKCLPNSKGDVWIVGQGCGKHPLWVKGTPVKTAYDCQFVGGVPDANTCNACVGGKSQYVVGAGCCTELNKQRTLTQGCVLDTQALCKKITSAEAGIKCLDCLKANKTFTLGSGCSE